MVMRVAERVGMEPVRLAREWTWFQLWLVVMQLRCDDRRVKAEEKRRPRETGAADGGGDGAGRRTVGFTQAISELVSAGRVRVDAYPAEKIRMKTPAN